MTDKRRTWGKRHSARGAALIMAVLSGAVSACAPRYPLGDEPAPFSFARAHIIERRSDCLRGPAADGAPGDFLLENDRVRVVIDLPQHPHGFAHTGGNILDAAPRGGEDHLTQVFTYFGDRFFRQAHYREIAVAREGGVGHPAEVVVKGTDSGDESIRVVTSYSLRSSDTFLSVRTTVVNTGPGTVEGFGLGDAVEWGGVRRFVPGRGFEEGPGWSEGPWVAAVTGPGSYGWAVPREEMTGSHGWGWSDLRAAKVTLAPGDTVVYERYLVIGTGDIASVANEVFRLRGSPMGRLRGEVREEGGEVPVPDATVRVSRKGVGPLLEIAADSTGGFTSLLPPGDYLLAARAPGREASAPAGFTLAAGEFVSWEVELPAASFVEFQVAEAEAETAAGDGVRGDGALPARLVFFALPPTPEPEFLSTGELVGRGSALFAPRGEGRVPLLPGRYRLWVTHGPEFEAAGGELMIDTGDTVALRVELARLAPTSGAVAADFGLHTSRSFDCGVGPAERVIELVANGMEVAAVTDDRAATDLEPTIKELGFPPELRTFRGTEVNSPELGRMSVFPLVGDPNWGELGEKLRVVSELNELTAVLRTLPGDPVLVMSHPLRPHAAGLGVFGVPGAGAPGPGERYAGDFDALEILRGGRLEMAEWLLDVWADLLNQGQRYTGLGSSGSDLLVSPEAGFPRTYLLAGVDGPRELGLEDLKRSVREHRVVVTNGPFLRLGANGRGIGESLSLAPEESLRIEIGLEAAPWIEVARVELRENGNTVRSFNLPPASAGEAVHFRRELVLRPRRDSWYIAVAHGGRFAVSAAAAGERGDGRPFAFTNPIWVDADGDGEWTPPGVGARQP